VLPHHCQPVLYESCVRDARVYVQASCRGCARVSDQRICLVHLYSNQQLRLCNHLACKWNVCSQPLSQTLSSQSPPTPVSAAACGGCQWAAATHPRLRVPLECGPGRHAGVGLPVALQLFGAAAPASSELQCHRRKPTPRFMIHLAG
jgi:hypothetical protein